GARVVAGRGDARLPGNVGKGAVAVVVVETVLAEVRDVEVQEAVVVEVAGAGPLPVAEVPHAGAVRHVGEMAAAVVVVENAAVGAAAEARAAGERAGLDDVQVGRAVVVVVEEAQAGAARLQEVL